MSKEEIKRYLDQWVYENDQRDITGEVLNRVLKLIVDKSVTEGDLASITNTIVSNLPPSGIATEGAEWIMYGEN